MSDLVFRLGKSWWILKSPNISSWNCKVVSRKSGNSEFFLIYLCLLEGGRRI